MPKRLDRQSGSKIRFAFLTRHLNRSGYCCLRALIDEGLVPQVLIVSSQRPYLVSKWRRPVILWLYKLKCWYYRCRPLRAIQSEEALALDHGIEVLAVESLKSQSSYDAVVNLDLDLLVVAGGWHEKIPISVLEAPRKGSINVHPSLLPEFRGTSITRWQVLEGVKISGVSVHQMDGEFDSGRTISQASINVPLNITPQELFQMLADASAPLLVRAVRVIGEGGWPTVSGVMGDERYIRYYPKWKWDQGSLLINPHYRLLSIGRQILAATQESYEYPGPTLCLNGRKFMIRGVTITPRRYRESEIAGKDDLCVLEGDYLRWERGGEVHALLITQIQPCEPRYFLRRADKPKRWLGSFESIVISSAQAGIREE